MDEELNAMVAAECCFLDVGQGTCNVLYLGGGRVVIIDGGPETQIPSSLLWDLGVRVIEALIVSHNDRDHLDGARAILSDYRDAVRAVFFLIDRDPKNIKLIDFLNVINDSRLRRNRGAIRIFRLERSRDPHVVFEDKRLGLSLDLLYPDYMANVVAHRASKPNSTSGVLRLSCGRRTIVFAGDSPIAAWAWIHDNVGTVHCDVLAAPHHGGVVWKGRKSDRVREELEWLYSEAIRCRFAIVSTGTSNAEGHPRAESIRAIRNAADETGARPGVLCTQLTERCCRDPRMFRPGIIPPHRSSLSMADPVSGRSVACAGTVVVEIGPEEIEIHRFGLHQEKVEELSHHNEGHPLCRP
jgi:Metallo-beta-lactamase superfamily